MRKKLQSAIVVTFKLIMAITIVIAFSKGQILNAIAVSAIFFLTILPHLSFDFFDVKVPYDVEFVIVIFIIATLFLGSYSGYYEAIWWWDDLLHFSSGMILSVVGYITIFIFNRDEKLLRRLNGVFMGVFTFTFAVSLGVFWELFEYMMDTNFNTSMLRTGIDDTMLDFVMNIAGSAVTAVVLVYYAKKRYLNRYLLGIIKP